MTTLLLKKLIQQVLKMQELQEYLEQMELKLDNEFLAMQILKSASSLYVKSFQTRLDFVYQLY